MKAAMQSIKACYASQAGAADYGAGLEACIAQDYVVSHALAERHSSLTNTEQADLGEATPDAIRQAMKLRVEGATKGYPVSFAFVADLVGLVEAHGTPVYRAIAFPGESK